MRPPLPAGVQRGEKSNEIVRKQLLSLKQKAIYLSRKLRKNQTNAELNFWKILKDKGFFGYKFLRQHPLYYEFYGKKRFFIADFYCSKQKIVIEIDGGVHENQADYDKVRGEILEAQKDLRVIRFKNEEILSSPNKVVYRLKTYLEHK